MLLKGAVEKPGDAIFSIEIIDKGQHFDAVLPLLILNIY